MASKSIYADIVYEHVGTRPSRVTKRMILLAQLLHRQPGLVVASRGK